MCEERFARTGLEDSCEVVFRNSALRRDFFERYRLCVVVPDIFKRLFYVLLGRAVLMLARR